MPKLDDSDSEILNAEFSLEEVVTIILNLPPGKAPGPDNTPSEVCKVVVNLTSTLFLDVLIDIQTTKYLPPSWHEATITIFSKTLLNAAHIALYHCSV